MVYSVGYINISSSCLFPNPTQSEFRFQRRQQLEFQNRLQASHNKIHSWWTGWWTILTYQNGLNNLWINLWINWWLNWNTIYQNGPFCCFLLCRSFIYQFFLQKFPFSPFKSAYVGGLSTMTYAWTAIGVRRGLITFQFGKSRSVEDLGKIWHFEFGSDLVLGKSQYRFKTKEKFIIMSSVLTWSWSFIQG